MRADKREVRVRVIEGRWTPDVLRVTLRAIVRELIRLMRWILRAVERRLMTLITLRVGQLIISTHVTLSALNGSVRALQREIRIRMIERGRSPCIDAVTLRAVVREIIRRVIWIGRVREIRRVTLPAIREREVVIPIHVTVLTGRCCMCALQRERCCGMVER